MEELKLGGFPPLLKKNSKDIKDKEKKTSLEPQFFSTIKRQNINIREILSKKTETILDEKTEELDEVDSI